ncbi:MAG: PrgI family protein [Clostridia bacterium]|nr:PrgI family protein [Clostridia bacterium]
MGTYQVPRNVKGEGRILFIFSKKALLYSAIGVGVGFFFVLLFGIIRLDVVGYVIMGVLGLLGFAIGTFKMPDTNAFEITKKTGGENIDDVIKRAIKFKRSGNRIYVYEKPENLKSHIEKTNDKEDK